MNTSIRKLGPALTLAVLLAGCNLPGAGGGGPTPITTSTLSPSAEPTALATAASTATSAPPTEIPWQPDPNVTPIPPLPAGTQLDLTWIHMITNLQGWAIGGTAGSSNHVFTTQDGGGLWQDVTPPQASDVGMTQAASGYFLDTQTAWVVFHPEGGLDGSGSMPLLVWRTLDGGSSWTPSPPLDVDLSGAAEALPELFFSDVTHGWLMLHLGGAGMHRYPVYLMRTLDGGASWETLVDPYGAVYLQSCAKTGMNFKGSTGVVSIGSCPIDGAEIYASSDAGVTWTEVRLPLPEGHDYLAGNAGCQAHSPGFRPGASWSVAMECRTFGDPPETLAFLYQSTDEGVSWSIQGYPGGSVYFLDPQNGWAFGKDIFRTTDGGASWARISTVTWEGQFNVVDAQIVFAIARSGAEIALVKSQNGGVNWSIVDAVVGP